MAVPQNRSVEPFPFLCFQSNDPHRRQPSDVWTPPRLLDTFCSDAVTQEGVWRRVAEYLHDLILDFVRRRDRYVDISLTRFPVSPATVTHICRRLSASFSLRWSQHYHRLRIFKDGRGNNDRNRFWSMVECPLVTFPGSMIYIRWLTDAEFCCGVLHRHGVRCVGMDTEWRPNRAGTKDDHRTALIQLCFKTPDTIKRGCMDLPVARGKEYVCFLLHVLHHGMNPNLVSVLQDEGISKVGVEIEGDISKLKKHYGVDVRSAVELYDQARERGIHARGLRSLFSATVGHDYPKDRAITMSNWNDVPLSEQQQDYAACDAFAALRIHEKLNDHTRG